MGRKGERKTRPAVPCPRGGRGKGEKKLGEGRGGERGKGKKKKTEKDLFSQTGKMVVELIFLPLNKAQKGFRY